MTYYFERDRLLAIADEHRDAFATAEPFRHVVIDDFVPTDVLDEVLAAYPEPTGEQWQQFNNPREKKFALRDEGLMPPPVRHLIQQGNSQVFVEFLERLTGISGLVVDTTLAGGGLHQITRDGLLKVHADFNKHEHLGLDRRLNALLYLNKDWQPEWGGHLELWDESMSRKVKSVAPTFNRLLVFATTSTSYHGHPDPLTVPEGRYRRSMAWYYYTNGRPASEQGKAHDTLFQSRPGEDIAPDADRRSPARKLASRVKHTIKARPRARSRAC